MQSRGCLLNSPLRALLESVLSDRTDQEQSEIARLLMKGAGLTDRDKDVLRKRQERSEAARIVIPDVVDPQRRERCLEDPELFLKTYFASRYKRPFGSHHHAMMDALISRAKHGGKQAVAAPRGCGKSELVKGLQVYLVLASLVRFLVSIASTSDLAKKLFLDFRKKIRTNDLLYQDFPEVCSPVRDLGGAQQRAAKQHVDGQLTNIIWTASDYISLPHVPGSVYGGVKMTYYGLDSAFRGINIDGDRPDFVIVDDPETRESAKSLMQIGDREKILDQDIAGLVEEGETMAIAVLTTIQNRICLSYRLTSRDPDEGKPAFNGMRFGLIKVWPKTVEDATDETKLGLWGDYITQRKKDQAEGDEHGQSATALYLANFEEMNEGHEMLTDHFVPSFLDDGTQVTHTALQVAFNKIADTSLSSFRSEYQNDPEEEGEVFNIKLASHSVISCESEVERGYVDESTSIVTRGIDVRKIELHQAAVSLSDIRLHRIPDYSVRSHGSTETTVEMAEDLILDGLNKLADEIDAEPLHDPNGNPVKTDLTLIDKNWFGSWKEDGETKTWATQPVETFCINRAGGHRRWMPAVGHPVYKSPSADRDRIVGDNWHINVFRGKQKHKTEVVWNAEHWHALVEELFVVTDRLQRFELFHGEPGGIYAGHRRLQQHIREGAEDLRELRVSGNRKKKRLFRRDHWWDALAMGLVAQSVEQYLREAEKKARKRRSLGDMRRESGG